MVAGKRAIATRELELREPGERRGNTGRQHVLDGDPPVVTLGVERWTTGQLDQAIALLLTTDAALKESRLSSEEQAMSTLILSLCALASRPARSAA